MSILPEGDNGRRNAAIFMGIFGLILLGIGVFVWRSDAEPEMEIIRQVDESVETAKAELVVDIEGAVKRPGVYKMKEGDRVADVILAAGGVTEDADVNWVELHINKAEKVEDGYKLYIPRVNERGTGSTAEKITSGIISINYATSGELESLPGVGEVTAGKIIQGRPYSKVEDLKTEKIVSQKIYEQIKPLISL